MICTYTHAHARHTAKSARHLFFLFVCVGLSLSRLTRGRGAVEVSIIRWRQWVTRSDADDAAAAVVGRGGASIATPPRRRAVG